jgi:hypothetical protein
MHDEDNYWAGAMEDRPIILRYLLHLAKDRNNQYVLQQKLEYLNCQALCCPAGSDPIMLRSQLIVLRIWGDLVQR